MAHAQKPHFVFRRNGRVHLNRQGRQFIRLLAAELCASAVVMLDTPCSEVVWRVLATHPIRQFRLHFPTRASLRTIKFQLDSTTRNTLKVGNNYQHLTSVTKLHIYEPAVPAHQLAYKNVLCGILLCKYVQGVIGGGGGQVLIVTAQLQRLPQLSVQFRALPSASRLPWELKDQQHKTSREQEWFSL